MSAWVVSKSHIDLMVQAAIAGPTDGSWTRPGEAFSWYHDHKRHEIAPYAEIGEESGHRELVPPSVLGQRLVSECVASVHGRYPDTDPDVGDLPGPIDAYYMGPYVFEPVVKSAAIMLTAGFPSAVEKPATIAVIAKQISCYEYQSCEHDEWRESEAYAFCEAMNAALLHSLPGYEAAPWGFDLATA